ncbi:unnamed protein product [Amoebophrya sp. A25]|nr:unnamed protein product [Amoebophrya sp. A25]|eukprot:GSA25T00013235001.1
MLGDTVALRGVGGFVAPQSQALARTTTQTLRGCQAVREGSCDAVLDGALRVLSLEPQVSRTHAVAFGNSGFRIKRSSSVSGRLLEIDKTRSAI